VIPGSKFVPVIVSVKVAWPATVKAGLKLLILGRLGIIVKIRAADVPAEVVTVILAVPAAAIRSAGITALKLDGLRQVVANGVPPHIANASQVKSLP
jgi:hypothetical protein